MAQQKVNTLEKARGPATNRERACSGVQQSVLQLLDLSVGAAVRQCRFAVSEAIVGPECLLDRLA